MASTQYRSFAAGVGANALTQSAWEALTTLRSLGFQSGVARSDQVNTLLRQVSVPTAGLAKFIANAGTDTFDDGSLDNFAAALLAAVRAVARAYGAPAGAVISGYWVSAPDGYLLLRGQLCTRSLYPDLWAHIQSLQALVPTLVRTDANWLSSNPDTRTSFSTGDGTSTFRLPDLRGIVATRAYDAGRGLDSGRVLGSYQADALQNIIGGLGVVSGGQAGSGAFAADGAPAGKISAGISGTNQDFSFDASRVARTSTETRPTNVALSWAIKY